MNSVVLIGNLTKDPELRQTQSGISTCSFTVAVSRKSKNSEGKYESDFINCVAWRATAEFVQRYFVKGSKIGLTGSIQTRSWDAQDGAKRYATEVVVDSVEFVGSKNGNDGQKQTAKAETKQEQMELTPVDSDDQLPF